MTDSLISAEEAEEVVSLPGAINRQIRTPLMIILGALVVVIATLLILVLLSLRDSRTGWEALLPFLDSRPTNSLQTD